MELVRGDHELPPAVLGIPKASWHWVGFASKYRQGGHPGGPGRMAKNNRLRILLRDSVRKNKGLTRSPGGDGAAADDIGRAPQGKMCPLCKKITS